MVRAIYLNAQYYFAHIVLMAIRYESISFAFNKKYRKDPSKGKISRKQVQKKKKDPNGEPGSCALEAASSDRV